MFVVLNIFYVSSKFKLIYYHPIYLKNKTVLVKLMTLVFWWKANLNIYIIWSQILFNLSIYYINIIITTNISTTNCYAAHINSITYYIDLK